MDKPLLCISLIGMTSTSERPAQSFLGRRDAAVMADQKIVDNKITNSRSNDDDGVTDEDDKN